MIFLDMISLIFLKQISKLTSSVNQISFQLSFEGQIILLRPILLGYDISKKSIWKFSTELSKISFWKVIKGKGLPSPFSPQFHLPCRKLLGEIPQRCCCNFQYKGVRSERRPKVTKLYGLIPTLFLSTQKTFFLLLQHSASKQI